MKILRKKQQQEVIERIIANHLMATDLIDICSEDEKRENRLTKITENTVRSLSLVGGMEATTSGLLALCQHKLGRINEMVSNAKADRALRKVRLK